MASKANIDDLKNSPFFNDIKEAETTLRKMFDAYDDMLSFKETALARTVFSIRQHADILLNPEDHLTLDDEVCKELLSCDVHDAIENETFFPVMYAQSPLYTIQFIAMFEQQGDSIASTIQIAKTEWNEKGKLCVLRFGGFDDDNTEIWENADQEFAMDYLAECSLESKAYQDFIAEAENAVPDDDPTNDDESTLPDAEDGMTKADNLIYTYVNRYTNIIRLHAENMSTTKIKMLNPKDNFGLPDFVLTSKTQMVNYGIAQHGDDLYAVLINDDIFKNMVGVPITTDKLLGGIDETCPFTDKMDLKTANRFAKKIFQYDGHKKSNERSIYIPASKDRLIRLPFKNRRDLRNKLRSPQVVSAADKNFINVINRWITSSANN